MNERRRGLKAATYEKHRYLDGLIGRFADRRAYEGYLKSTLAFRTSLERQLQGVKEMALGMSPLNLVDPLTLDFKDLRIDPVVTHLPSVDMDGTSAVAGALYVLEGSALGAILLRQDAKRLGFDESFGARHLAVQTETVGRWSAFLRILDEIEPFNLDAAIVGACQTFDAAIAAGEAARVDYEC